MNTRSREVDTIWSGRSSSQAESSTVLIGGVMTYQLGNASGVWSPTAVAVWDVGGDFALLVADTDNHRILRLTPPPEADEADEGAPRPMWTLSHFAGSGRRGMENGDAYMANFRYPHAIAVCMDSSAQARARRLSEGAAGEAEEGEGAELVDPAVAALQGVTVLVADTGNHVIRLVRAQDPALLAEGESSWGAAAQVETLAGDGTPGSEDSLTKREKPKASVLLSSILTARFALPQGVDCDGQGGAIVADTYNQAVRHVGPGGITVTLAGGERNGNVDGSGTAAEFSEPVRAACRTTLRELGPCSHTQGSPTACPVHGCHPTASGGHLLPHGREERVRRRAGQSRAAKGQRRRLGIQARHQRCAGRDSARIDDGGRRPRWGGRRMACVPRYRQGGVSARPAASGGV